jgi:hypothetical protein
VTAATGSIAELQFEALRTSYPGSELLPLPGGIWLVRVPGVPLPLGWNQTATSVWFLVPVGFPAANPDCFFADSELRLASGGMPGASGVQPIPHTGTPHTWFSWHVTAWNPGRDTLLTYVRVIRDRLSRAQ